MWDYQYSHIHIEHENIQWNIVVPDNIVIDMNNVIFLNFTMCIMKYNQVKTTFSNYGMIYLVFTLVMIGGTQLKDQEIQP
jgi:hypothetical protein